MCVNNLHRVALDSGEARIRTRDLLIASPASHSLGHQATRHIIVEVAKALGGSFKLVTLAPETVNDMTQLPKETQKNEDIQTN